MEDSRTLYVGNLSEQVTEELLYELFLQVGPVDRVKIPTDREGRQLNYGFVTFKHEASVPYTIQLFQGVQLFDNILRIQPRNNPTQRDRQEPFHPVQRSFSYPIDAFNNSSHEPNHHIRFDQHSNFNQPNHSVDDLIRMGMAMNVNYNYPEQFPGDYNNSPHHGEKPYSRHSRDYQCDRGRREYEYDRPKFENDRDRRNDYGNNRNYRNNSNKRNFDRNGGRRNKRYY